MEAICVITLLDTVQPPFLKDRWTIGYQDSFQNGEQLLNDALTIADISGYRYAVIENIRPGAFPTSKPRRFYIRDETSFIRIPEPPELKQLVNFAMG